MTDSNPGPSPDALLRATSREGRGRLKIFLGAAPGVGKTFEMLREGAERAKAGVDTVIAVVETHGRAETQALVAPFEVIPRRKTEYQGHHLEEMDLDAVLARRPALALVDEYAHSNVAGGRHPKRWQDVAELLDAGIDVYTTLNIQHVESLNDVVASFTRVRVRETVPDSIFDGAEIEIVDLPPDELIERLKEGKVYIPAEASRALGSFFSKQNLSALREMALRRAAQSVDQAMLDHLDAFALSGTYAGGERIVVAVDERPGATAVVRAAKRLADALKAPLQAVYVETPDAHNMGEKQKRQLADSLRLAANLGATIATIPAVSVVSGLTQHLASVRATQVILGGGKRYRWRDFAKRSLSDAILQSGNALAVHVIPVPVESTEKRAWWDIAAWSNWPDYIVISALVAVTTLIGKGAEPLIGAGGIDLLYLLPVMVASVRYGLGRGVLTGVAASLAYNFFFLPPIHTFAIAEPQSLLTLFVLLGVGVFTASLANRLKMRAVLGARSANENAAIAAFGQALTHASDWRTSGQIVCEEISSLLGVNVVLMTEADELLAVRAASSQNTDLGPVNQAAAEWAWVRGETAGAGTATLNAADWQFHPLTTSVGILAVVGLANEHGTDPVGADRAVLLSTLLGQASLALERLRLEDDVRAVTIIKERDRLRAALLSSIGHDLRTPLTAIAGALDAIAQQHPDAAALPMARIDVGRLRRFLDNLLDMVRIDTGKLEPRLEAVDLVDAVASAVHDLKDQLLKRHIDLRVPANLPLVNADPVLLHHVLLNLLTNASIHGAMGESDRIIIEGKRTPDAVTLAVRDNGPGLNSEDDGEMFDNFARGKGDDRQTGSGLGLAIVKGFAQAMNVGVMARNHEDGGAEFTIVFQSVVSANP